MGSFNKIGFLSSLPIEYGDETCLIFLSKNPTSSKAECIGGICDHTDVKYQPQPKDLKFACSWAKMTTDVATTSGVGTGKAANIDKIKLIREYLGKHPMAIASGVSANNVDDYKGIADYLLVASSITTFGEIIVKDKLIELNSKL